jgi:PAS domain S-box-containing protein
VLVLAAGGDLESCRGALEESGVEYSVCAGLPEVLAELANGAAGVLLTDDVGALPDFPKLIEVLRYQPPWSDLPILLLSNAGAGTPTAARSIAMLGNVVVLDRPPRVASLVSALRTASRARERQYALRDQLEALRKSEERLELAAQATHAADVLHAAIVESSDDAILSKTLDGTIRSWNAGAERLFGYTAEEAVGQPIALILPPDKYDEEAQILARLSRGERIDHFETVRVAKGGRLLQISLTVSPIADRNGRVVGASKVARDITARKLAEQELERQDVLLRLLWESAAVLLTTDRPDTMLRGVFDKIAPSLSLDAYMNFLAGDPDEGLKLESWAGLRAEDVEALRSLPAGQSLSGRVAETREPIAIADLQSSPENESTLERRFGFRAFAGFPLLAEGRLLGTLAFGTRAKTELAADEVEFLETICRYVTAAYERVDLIRRLRDTDNRKDEFLATLAHELRNPLAPIRNALEIMRVDGRDHTSVGLAARTMIERQLEQMVRLVDDLLDVSRITRGRLELRKERVDLAQVIKSAVETSRPLIDAAHHSLDVDLPSPPVYLDADPVRLAQVFANLLNNAARYMDRGGRVRVSARRAGAYVQVAVTDTGMGIAADALPRIFDMFAQVHQTRESSRTGLGIGLTLVKRLVELHGGTVAAHSEGAGRGTELLVRLPMAAAAGTARAPAVADAVPEAVPASRPITYRILVADDNRDAAESMGMLLRLMGNEVRTVYDGVKAVEEAAAFRPDVILLDIGMPKLNGYDAAKQIREQRWSEGTMLVALTGWGQEEDKRKASEAGFDRHFTKPLDPAELQRLISEFRAN